MFTRAGSCGSQLLILLGVFATQAGGTSPSRVRFLEPLKLALGRDDWEGGHASGSCLNTRHREGRFFVRKPGMQSPHVAAPCSFAMTKGRRYPVQGRTRRTGVSSGLVITGRGRCFFLLLSFFEKERRAFICCRRSLVFPASMSKEQP